MTDIIKRGFSLVELVIVVTIVTALIALGGFKYLEYKKQATALEFKNHADNISRIITNMYNTGVYGDNKTYQFKGSYPSVQTMNTELTVGGKKLIEDIISSYAEGSTDSDGANNIEYYITDADYNSSLNEASILRGLVSSDPNEIQQYLKNHSNLIIYHPLHPNIKADGSRGTPNELCLDQISGVDNCRRAAIYYVNYKDGKYELAESNRLRAGIRED